METNPNCLPTMLFFFLTIVLGLGLALALGQGNATCPLNVDALRKVVAQSSQRLVFLDVQTECQYMLQGLRLIRSEYLRSTGYFFPPSSASEACWDSYEGLIQDIIAGFHIRSACGFKTSLMSESCMNVTTRVQFERLISESGLKEIRAKCNQSLENSSSCASCIGSLSTVNALFSRGANDGNASDCASDPFVYAAAFANRFGPTDLGTAMCLFSLDFTSTGVNTKRKRVVLGGVLVGSLVGLIGAVSVVWVCWRRQKKRRERRKNFRQIETGLVSARELIGGSTSVAKFTFEEIKKATNNFHRENIIGRGGYGNVYKGVLDDESEVAVKRFKNCSAVGDEMFSHEVEIIASVKHVNLVALIGYCTDTAILEGHQLIIVCDLMRNGSLYDHLFGSGGKKIPWPIRQKIAIGMARGLAYLHYGVHPAIIHRDVKASNVLLDETFEPKLADFGLAKFTPEGVSHLSTRVAGTLGYFAPEYALYGQLSERSDVFSFGVVLLELLSGKKAVISVDNEGTFLLSDWAWSLVKEGRVMEVIDEGMPELGLPEVMEKYVLVAVLSSHPLLYARPTMDHIVKILEKGFPAPPIPDRPLPFVAAIADIEQSASYSGPTFTSSPACDRPFIYSRGSSASNS